MEDVKPPRKGTGLNRYPCEQCGAQLEYQPGTTSLKCPYCGHTTPIAPPSTDVEEQVLEAFFDKARLDTALEIAHMVHCNSCAAEYSVPPEEVTHSCPFCGSNVVVDTEPEHRIRPNGLLPFGFKEFKAREHLGQCLGSRFWAPNDLKKMALKEGRMKGIYTPYWTYDSDTTTEYTGMRGEYYYVTETYRDSNGNTQTRTVRKTRWWPASGTVNVSFDDVLVLGSDAIPEKYGQRLRTWDLENLTSYEQQYLVGFQSLRYSRDLAQCWETAKGFMEPDINNAIRRDIGGDEQQITWKSSQYYNNTFKHLLLPVYAGSYRYRSKSFRVLINGRTGEVQGEAPISFWKVLLAVILALIVIGTAIYFYQEYEKQNPSSGSSSTISINSF